MYNPSRRNKEDMYFGIRDRCIEEGINPAEERPELSPHYDASKLSFKKWNAITFCAVCKSGDCACNRYIAHGLLSTCRMIYKLDKLGVGKKILLTLHHFYRADEIEYFLLHFTKVIKIQDIYKYYDAPKIQNI